VKSCENRKKPQQGILLESNTPWSFSRHQDLVGQEWSVKPDVAPHGSKKTSSEKDHSHEAKTDGRGKWRNCTNSTPSSEENQTYHRSRGQWARREAEAGVLSSQPARTRLLPRRSDASGPTYCKLRSGSAAELSLNLGDLTLFSFRPRHEQTKPRDTKTETTISQQHTCTLSTKVNSTNNFQWENKHKQRSKDAFYLNGLEHTLIVQKTNNM
jgi:hypothetical protein